MSLGDTLERLAQPDLSGDPRLAEGFDAAVAALFDQLAEWCSSPDLGMPIAVDRFRFTLSEDGYRPRELPLLCLSGHGWSATLRPVGAQIAGAKGRVDVRAGDGESVAMLLLDANSDGDRGAPYDEGRNDLRLDLATLALMLGDLATGAQRSGEAP